ncbi:MAG TPA: FAD-dependent oxidoreductase [bacterium]|nr:FAD-dependent oxidoreductase [bacterium]
MKQRKTEVLIVGAGPAGLAAALELKRLGLTDLLVLERDPVAGGMPRFCHHTGFGILDRHRLMTGPGYAAAWVADAKRQQVELLTQTTVIDWTGPLTCLATGPEGLQEIEARAVLLATGCRERPRAARLVAGSRSQGIFTTGSLQDFVHHLNCRVGKRAVIVGAEKVSLSALMTLAKARCRAVAMVTSFPRHQFYGIYRPAKIALADLLHRAPVKVNSAVHQILGHERVEAVEIKNLLTGDCTSTPCDTVVFTGDWIPDYELARSGGVPMDAGTLGPAVDRRLRTRKDGVFAAGNLLRGAETADVAAKEGILVARSIQTFLNHHDADFPCVPIVPDAAVRWVSPNLASPEDALMPCGKVRFSVKDFYRPARVRIEQADQVLFEQRLRACVPNTSYAISDHWMTKVNFAAGPVRFSVVQ